MPVIKLTLRVNAPIHICFDLARSIDLHSASVAATDERAIAGRTSGLIAEGETVTWEARHFGVRQRLTSKITAFSFPFHFRDEQVKGAFKYMKHDHYFIAADGGTIMKDVFEYAAPLGVLGKCAERIFLTGYMRRFLVERNHVIREVAADAGKWQQYLAV